MSGVTSEKTIRMLFHLFSLYGLPDQLVSDNRPQFTSSEFSRFMKLKGIHHFRSAPYHPATNGLVERFNKTLKQAIKTGKYSGKSIQETISEFLFRYHSTPHSTTGVSPSELFLRRKMKITLDLLKPDLQRRVEEKQTIQKHGQDGKGKERIFEIGQSVWAKDYRQGYPLGLRGECKIFLVHECISLQWQMG